MKKSFSELISEESAVVESIINIMVHTRKEEARHFLTLVNTILDYYMNGPVVEGKINYPIIYLPHTPSWAREVLMKFLI